MRSVKFGSTRWSRIAISTREHDFEEMWCALFLFFSFTVNHNVIIGVWLMKKGFPELLLLPHT